jgi:NAD(P)-dependent dehydrogenase (short-subunit alcohol dehydrogenase family)
MTEAAMAGKVLLVTGGSRGIGAATCRLAARRGYAVAVNYARDAAAAEAVVRDIEAAGMPGFAVQGDVAREADVERVFAEVDRRLGRLTHLVNNAGATGRLSRVDEADPAMVKAVLDLNVYGAFLCAQAAIRRLSTRHGGRGGAIVNISSAASGLGSPNEFVWYAASKGAVDSMTYGLAREVAREGIRVNAVAPGLIETDIHEAAGDADRVARIAPTVPMGRSASAEEVAETILFLLSDAASYVTGSVLKVSDGR